MNKTQKTLGVAATAFMVYASAMNAYGISQSDFDSFSDDLDRTEWSHTDGFTARANLQNPLNCGISALFRPHATLLGDNDMSQGERHRERNREFLCKDLFTGETFEREFTIQMPR